MIYQQLDRCYMKYIKRNKKFYKIKLKKLQKDYNNKKMKFYKDHMNKVLKLVQIFNSVQRVIQIDLLYN